jgi:hypothetical protein
VADLDLKNTSTDDKWNPCGFALGSTKNVWPNGSYQKPIWVIVFWFCRVLVVRIVSCLVCNVPIAVYLVSPIDSWASVSLVALSINRIVLSPVLNVLAGIWNSKPILP